MSLPPFALLVDEHWRDVARLAHALARPGEGDDVAQQAWAQALAAYPRLTDARNLRSWLLTVTARCATDSHRSGARRAAPVAELPEVVARAADPGDDDATSHAAAGEALWDAVRGLPPRQRTAVALRYVADLDHAAVARALGTTPAASRRLVSDALARLRRTVPDLEELS